ncbi:homer protein homolog 3-like isoform X1 [Coregonus clupeaformis]|uniref:homer protein homolog 3-like isoform X1 n=1 Tax=Coregonus clupeaformis TaxID=59861 RepID=UPI001BE0832D|nr:homer protein homolog 3-like isoform X1 [Coregonus clupeaformis]XP_041697689.1 homer protein homolog 3-like isoform X1 [Coregonus clupeaformis]
MYPHHREREQPIFSARAHVFQIDPNTKRNWIPASKHAVTVSFFYDANRNVYRIISVGGTKAIINCTITPSMTFTRTSQKFGQWADSRANTVYGLGFATEQQLHQFSERFKEVKEAARLACEKSQDKMELANTALSIAAPQFSQDLSDELQSPPVMCVNGPEDKMFRSQSADFTLSSEKERIKKMLSEGSICEMNLEAELFTLQDSNSKLVAALHEANNNVEQWKKQLVAYQEETERLRDQVADLEAHGGHGPSDMLKDELTRSLEELEALLKAKDEEIHILQNKKEEYHEMEQEREEAIHRLQEMEMRNLELERRVQNVEQNLAASMEERDHTESEVQRAIEILDVKIFDLNDLRQSLVKLIDK